MTTVSCPRCGDKVTAPTTESGDAVVRCPLCSEEYPLQEALRSAPPMLIVVSSSRGASAAPLKSGSDENAIRLAPADAPKPFVFEERPAPRKIAPRPRPQRREKNALVEVVKIVAGGLVGLSIGQLILWWVPGLQLGQRDPVHLAPKLSKYVPWIIPPALRQSEEVALSDGDQQLVESLIEKDRAARNKRSKSEERKSDRSSKRDFASGFSGSTNNERNSDGNSTLDSGSELKAPPDLDPNRINDLDTEPLENIEEDSSPGVINAPVLSAADVKAALNAARKTWSESSSSADLNQLRKAMKHLARSVTFADSSDRDVQSIAAAARNLLREVAEDPSQLEELLATPDSSTSNEKFPGRLISGTIESIESAGLMFSSTLDSPDGQVQVISVVDPHQSMAEGDRVVILGVDVPKPQQQLKGFRGTALPVIFGGLVIKQPERSSRETRSENSPETIQERPPAAPLEGDTQSTIEAEINP